MALPGSAYGSALDQFTQQWNPAPARQPSANVPWTSANPTYQAPAPGSVVIQHPSGTTVTLHPMAALGSGPNTNDPAPPPSSPGQPAPSTAPAHTHVPEDILTPSPNPNIPPGAIGNPSIPNRGPATNGPVTHLPSPLLGYQGNPESIGSVGGAAGIGYTAPTYVDPSSPQAQANALPGINQINIRNWARLAPSAQQFDEGLYNTYRGITPDEIAQAIGNNQAAYAGTARAGTINA